MEDNKIIELYKQHMEEAIIETKSKYNGYITTIVYNILRNNEETEECVNDIYLKLWNCISENEPEHLKAYIGKVTRNTALNYLRDNKNKETVDVFDELIINSFEDSYIDSSIILNVINEFLHEIKGEKRVIFIRRYWFFESITDISKRMNISESKVKMILKRLREKLNIKLNREGI